MSDTTQVPTPGPNRPADPLNTKSADRVLEETLFQVFDQFALGDQRSYYEAAINKANKAASQINMLRAFFSLVTGIAAALAGLIVQSKISDPATCAATPAFCTYSQPFVIVLLIIAVVAPAIGGAFGTLADLYQWDRLETIYRSSLETLEVADALAPDSQMDDSRYRNNLRLYTEGTLGVMRDEASQWGQLIRDPSQLSSFIAAETTHAQQVIHDAISSAGGSPDNSGGTAANPAVAPSNTPLPAATSQPAPSSGVPSEGGALPPGTPPKPPANPLPVPPSNLDPTADG